MGRLAARLGGRRRRVEADPDPSPSEARAAALTAAGWVLPRAVTAGPSWTWLGTVGSAASAAVDTAGAVSPAGWSLDWWIGAEDRWHLPAAEPSVRQTLLGGSPVTETAMRVPGGDAVHRAYAVRSADGRDVVVVEVENRSHVPFAVALAVRPFDLVGAGRIGEITVEPMAGGVGRDQAHVVRLDGRAALLLPRRPAGWAASDGTDGDLVDLVTAGQAGTDLVGVRSPSGTGTAAIVLPLAHTAVLRVLLPFGASATGDDLPAVPPLDAVLAGWEAQDRGARLVVPDPRLAEALEASRRHVLLAAVGSGGRAGAGVGTGADDEVTPLVRGALDDLDRSDLLAVPDGAVPAPAAWPEVLSHPISVLAEATHLRRTGSGARLGESVEALAGAVEVLGRDLRRRRDPDPSAASLIAADGVDDLAALLAATQPDAAAALPELVVGLRERGLAASARRPTSGGAAEPPLSARRRLVEAGVAARNGDAARAFSLLAAVLDEGSETWTWAAPRGAGPRRDAGHDRAANAALVRTVRSLLVRDEHDGLALVPVFTDAWYGGGVEVHDLPTDWGRLSFAVRWHGRRPALLWDFDPWDEASPTPRLSTPGLDPTWSSTDRRGEALLAEVEPPADLDPLRVVAEHPDLDPAMRRPGRAPADLGRLQWSDGDDGGSFS